MGIKDFDKIFKNLPKIVEESVNKETLNEIGKLASERIRKRTRLGKGVKESEGATHPLPKLADATVKERKRLKSRGFLTGTGATPAKSGLNRTGEMLENIKHKVEQDTVKIRMSSLGEKKAQDVAKLNPNYEFMNISKAEFKALVSVLSKSIEKAIKKLKL